MADGGLLDDIDMIGADGVVSAEEVLTLRRRIFKDGVVSDAEVDALIALAARVRDGAPEWRDYFAEAIADHFIRQPASPTPQHQDALTEQGWTRLKTKVASVADASAAFKGFILDALVTLSEKASQTPDDFGESVAAGFRDAVLLKADGAHLTAADVTLLSRLVFAAGGDGRVAITRAEAEFLFDLADATAHGANAPEWPDFFATAVANHLLASVASPAPERATLSLVDPDDVDPPAPTQAPKGFLDRVKIWLSNPAEEVEKRYAVINAARDEDRIDAARIDEAEANWLIDRIGRDGVFHPLEEALIDKLQTLDATLPPQLDDFLAKFAAATQADESNDDASYEEDEDLDEPNSKRSMAPT